MDEFTRRAAIASGAISADFGEGWMTSAARDMVRIAAFAGFDIPQLVKRVAMTANPDRTTNARTVERVMSEMEAEMAAPCAYCGEVTPPGEAPHPDNSIPGFPGHAYLSSLAVAR